MIKLIMIAMLMLLASRSVMASSSSSSFGVGLTVLPDKVNSDNVPALVVSVDQSLPEFSSQWTNAYNNPSAREGFYNWGLEKISQCILNGGPSCGDLRANIIAANRLLR